MCHKEIVDDKCVETSVEQLNEKEIVFGAIDNDGIDEIVQVSHFCYDIDINPDMESYITAYKFKEKFTKIDIINKESK